MSTRHVSKSREVVSTASVAAAATTTTTTAQNPENGIVFDNVIEMDSAEKKKKRRSRWGLAAVNDDDCEANTNGGLVSGGKKESHDGDCIFKKEAGNNRGVNDELSRTLPTTHWSPSPQLLEQIVHKLHDPSVVKSVETSRQHDNDDRSRLSRKYDGGEIENGCNYPNTAIRLGPQSASSLSRIPWKYHPSSHMISGIASALNATNYDSRHGQEKATEETNLTVNHATQQHHHHHHHPNDVLPIPTYSYLDLRTHQNLQYATQRLHEWVHFAQSNHFTKAEACYKQGLEVAPNHVELLVAYGALCANWNQLDKANELLQRALELNPQCPNGKSYLDIVQNKMRGGNMKKQKEEKEVQQTRRKDSEVHERFTTSEMSDVLSKTDSTDKKKEEEKWKGGVISRTENAMRDALTERAFLMSGFGAGGGGVGGGVDARYPMLTEVDDDLEPPLENRDADGEERGDEKESVSSFDGRHGRKMRGDKERSRKHRDDRDDEHRRKEGKKGVDTKMTKGIGHTGDTDTAVEVVNLQYRPLVGIAVEVVVIVMVIPPAAGAEDISPEGKEMIDLVHLPLIHHLVSIISTAGIEVGVGGSLIATMIHPWTHPTYHRHLYRLLEMPVPLCWSHPELNVLNRTHLLIAIDTETFKRKERRQGKNMHHHRHRQGQVVNRIKERRKHWTTAPTSMLDPLNH